ncbi:MAG: hypothetical protein K2Q06_00985 [Parvularculaceae bacterium]|nr:hypothetical protein [Parvularculaceae bacterium]
MRALWIVGGLHYLVGSALLFLTLHPLRDRLDSHALHLVLVMSAFQAVQGLGIMVAARRAPLAAALIAAGVAASASMLYFIAFTGRHPFDPAVPIGGAVAFAGWALLLFARRERQSD